MATQPSGAGRAFLQVLECDITLLPDWRTRRRDAEEAQNAANGGWSGSRCGMLAPKSHVTEEAQAFFALSNKGNGRQADCKMS